MSSCQAPPVIEKSEEAWEWDLPPSFDSLPFVPTDNQITHSRVELGKLLFNDPRLSNDGLISCASCHKAAYAFADTVALSAGVHGKKDNRNSPSLLNVGYQKALFMEGGVPSLELQVLAPFGNPNEMDFTLTKAANILREDLKISDLSMKAYGKPLDGYVISRALSTYERSLTSRSSAWDRYQSGDTTALSESAKKGRSLFFDSKLACATCHTGFLFTDQDYHNIGLYTEYPDEGRSRLTMRDGDIGKFKTPGLRNVAITFPYMHDGSLKSLEAVIEFKNTGGLNHPNKSKLIQPLGLTVEQKRDLIAFLNSLTEESLY